MSTEITPFEQIRRTNPAGNEFWSSRDFARVLGYLNYRHFQAVIEKARTACFNSGQWMEDHFVGIDEMVGIGSGAQRAIPTVMMSRYACYLIIQNADPAKEPPFGVPREQRGNQAGKMQDNSSARGPHFKPPKHYGLYQQKPIRRQSQGPDRSGSDG